MGNLYEEDIAISSDTTPSTPPYIAYYLFGEKMVGMRMNNQPDPARNSQYRIVGDHLGSTTLVMNAGSPSTVVHRAYYKPYGEVAWQVGSSRTTLGFTGQRLDSETGLMDYGARYYDPVLSHFISADPTTPDALNPIDYHKYLYTRANPLRYIDTSGYGPDDYYVFVYGCSGDYQNPRACDPNRVFGEFEQLLYQEFLGWQKKYGPEQWDKYGIANWDVWRAQHVRAVPAPTPGEGVDNLRTTLAGIPQDGGDIHIWAHSGGGMSVLSYLYQGMYRLPRYGAVGGGPRGELDKRIASIALIDVATPIGGWRAEETEMLRKQLPRLQKDGLLQVHVNNSFVAGFGCLSGFNCVEGDYSQRAQYGLPGPPQEQPGELGPTSAWTDPVRRGWHFFSYKAVFKTNFEDWFRRAWR